MEYITPIMKYKISSSKMSSSIAQDASFHFGVKKIQIEISGKKIIILGSTDSTSNKAP